MERKKRNKNRDRLNRKLFIKGIVPLEFFDLSSVIMFHSLLLSMLISK